MSRIKVTNAVSDLQIDNNYIINGNFDIWQRGTTQTSNGFDSDDRWRNSNSGTTKTHSRQTFTAGQTDVPNNPKYYSRTVVVSSAEAANYALKQQRIESVLTLAGKQATLSFWAKADSSKNMAVEFLQNFGTGGSPSSAVTGIGAQHVALTSAWQKFSITVNIPSLSGKTLGTDGNDYLSPTFWFDAGSDYNSRSNSLGQQSGTFDIAQVKLEEGGSATPFMARPVQQELALCQRYFQTGELIKANTNDYWQSPFGNSIATKKTFLQTTMRTNPTVSYNISGADFEYYNYASPAWTNVASGPSTAKLTPESFWTYFGVASGQDGSTLLVRENGGVNTTWEADAEL